MKTTLDLPEEMVREMKLRVAQQGKKLREVATEVVRRGLASAGDSASTTKGKRVKLPLIVCKRVAPGAEPDPDQIAAILAGQDAEWSHEATGR